MIARLATPPTIVGMALVTVWLAALFRYRAKHLAELAGGEVTIIDGAFFSTPARLHGSIGSYGDAGRAFYRMTELTLDVVFPLAYALFLLIALAWAVRRGFPMMPAVASAGRALPIVGAAADLCENAGIAALLSAYPRQLPVVAVLTMIATPVKFLALSASLVLLVGAVVRWARRPVTARGSASL
jgi:hypothetical protein